MDYENINCMLIRLKYYGNILHIKLKPGKKFMFSKLTRKDQEKIYMMEFSVSHTSDPISKKIIYIMLNHIRLKKRLPHK